MFAVSQGHHSAAWTCLFTYVPYPSTTTMQSGFTCVHATVFKHYQAVAWVCLLVCMPCPSNATWLPWYTRLHDFCVLAPACGCLRIPTYSHTCYVPGLPDYGLCTLLPMPTMFQGPHVADLAHLFTWLPGHACSYACHVPALPGRACSHACNGPAPTHNSLC